VVNIPFKISYICIVITTHHHDIASQSYMPPFQKFHQNSLTSLQTDRQKEKKQKKQNSIG